MKNILFIITILFSGIFLTSCYDDSSTLDVNKIPEVVFDTSGMTKFGVFQFEHLVVNPKLETAGLEDSNLSYEWKINIEPNDTNYIIVGNERNVDFEVRFKPNSSDDYHLLTYTVTDNSTGLNYIMTWPVKVKNNLGEGLVVSETSDGLNSDLSLIMAPEVTTELEKVSIKYRVYSAINGKIINGLVKQMRFVPIYGVDALLAITDNSILRINTLEYTDGGMNEDLFYGHTGDFKPQALGAVFQGDMYVDNGQLTGTYLGAAKKFGLPFDSPYTVPSKVAFNASIYQPLPVKTSFYDEVNQLFVYQQTPSSYGDSKMYSVPSVVGEIFDPGSIKNKINLAAGVSDNGDFLHLLKDKSTGKVELYVLTGGVYVGYNQPITPPAPKALFDLSSAPDIANAKHFVLCDDQKVMYYATDSKIYAMLYGTSTPVFEERYTVPSGEEITTLQMYKQILDPYNPQPLPTHNKQLIMSTYSSEGKVYLLPIKNIGVGNIDEENIKSFGGFGRVTSITAQK